MIALLYMLLSDKVCVPSNKQTEASIMSILLCGIESELTPVGKRAVANLKQGTTASLDYRTNDASSGGISLEGLGISDLCHLADVVSKLPHGVVVFGYCGNQWLFKDCFKTSHNRADAFVMSKSVSGDIYTWLFCSNDKSLAQDYSRDELSGIEYLDHFEFADVTDICMYYMGNHLVPLEFIARSKSFCPDDYNFSDFVELPLANDEAMNNNSTRPAGVTSGLTETKPVQEDTNMSKVQNIVAANKNAAVSAAKLEAGRIALVQVTNVIKTKAPYAVKGYIDTPVGRAVVANLFSFAVAQYASNNRAAVVLSDAAMQAAALEIIQSFNIEQMITDVVNGVGAEKLAKLSGEVQE
ncbi:hypothetical protein P13BB106kb_p013 [Pectobacterium phage DU_PP_V]|uniref:Uncharacterized protein n=1 Tax=Pectobacterium phage DU_PP_V TaxID=2041492 RepID=A0A2D2W6S3_9CAUD|nr:hypothetical protein HOS40_gp013 [Pectobacterium phage DU_PP_V]ATS93997.1 hypothetical protein P13BB106kb_p013 [Pectobacterium phage DU_PP_V]